MTRFASARLGRRQFVARAGALVAAAPFAGACVGGIFGCGTNGAAALTPASNAEPDPKSLGWKTKIVTDEEPGEPLVVSGRIFAADGKTPLAGVVLYFYHTDARGIYSDQDGQGGPPNPRLKGWLKTDAEGRYEFRTIKPASYPRTRIPAHIHAKVRREGRAEEWIEEFWFEGDPHLEARSLESARVAGQFSNIMPLGRGAGGVLNCARDIRLKES